MKPTFLVVFVLIAGPWHFAAGQDVSPREERLAEAAGLLRIGQHIRVETVAGERLEGVLAASQESELELTAEAQPIRIVLLDVERLWVRGRAARTGALIGLGVGAILGAAAGLFVGEVICDNPDCHASTAGTVATFGLIGAGAGAGSGALIGLAVPSWHVRFP